MYNKRILHLIKITMNIFELLNIRPTSDFATVKKAYLVLVMKLHPDKTAGLPSVKRKEYEEQLKIISGVYDTVNTEGKFMLFWDIADAQ